MIESALESLEITSASPTHTNTVKQINRIEMPDLESLIREDKKDPVAIKNDKKVKDTVEKVIEFKEGNVGKLQSLTTSQMGNVTAFARNPFQFVVSSVFRKFTKGAGIAALAVIIFEAVKTIIEELFKPGRIWDTRFRERIDKQILVFLERKEQQELRQGFKIIRTTTLGGLRGNSLIGNLGGNLYNPERIPQNFLDARRTSSDNIISQDARHRSTLSVSHSRQRRSF